MKTKKSSREQRSSDSQRKSKSVISASAKNSSSSELPEVNMKIQSSSSQSGSTSAINLSNESSKVSKSPRSKRKVPAREMKSHIREAYMRRGMSVTELSRHFLVSDSTISRWLKKENWQELREQANRSSVKSPEVLQKKLETMIESLDSAIDNPQQLAKIADSISKIVKSIKTLYKDNDRLGSVLFAIGELGQYMNSVSVMFDESFRSKFDTLLAGFQDEMLLKYSPKNFQ